MTKLNTHNLKEGVDEVPTGHTGSSYQDHQHHERQIEEATQAYQERCKLALQKQKQVTLVEKLYKAALKARDDSFQTRDAALNTLTELVCKRAQQTPKEAA